MIAKSHLIGKRVWVKMVDGTKFVDVLVDRARARIIFKKHGHVRRETIKKIRQYVDTRFVWAEPTRPNEIDLNQALRFPQVCPLRNWVNIRPVYSSRDGRITHFEYGTWVTCQKSLDAHGKCPVHGQVRFNPHQAAREEKEGSRGGLERFRKWPPRRKSNGKTTALMMHIRTIFSW